MFCRQCGKEMPDGASFCTECGATMPKMPVPQEAGNEQKPLQNEEPWRAGQGASAEGSAGPVQPVEGAGTERDPSQRPPLGEAHGAGAAPRPAPQKGKKRTPLIIGIAVAVVVVAAIGIAFATGAFNGGGSPGQGQQGQQTTTGSGSTQVALATNLESAKEDAVDAANSLAGLTREIQQINEQPIEEGVDKYADYNERMPVVTKECLERVTNDIKIVEDAIAAGDSSDELRRVRDAMVNVQAMAQYDLSMNDIQQANNAFGGTAQDQYDSVGARKASYQSLDTPPCLVDALDTLLATYDRYQHYMEYYLGGRTLNDTLDNYSMYELEQWLTISDNTLTREVNGIGERQLSYAAEVIAGDHDAQTGPVFTLDLANEISPNLYPSMDSVANIQVEALDQQDVLIEVEIAGLTQKYEQKETIVPGVNYFKVKPALLGDLDASSLENNKTTQLNVKITDNDTGKVIEQQSKNVSLKSLYDFSWSNDEFGITAMFDILAWLRPQAEEVAAINRSAADYMAEWTGGEEDALLGYLGSNSWDSTLLQTCAIQKAISDRGIKYIVDNYSFSSDQAVLTPDAVVARKQAICIESSILMASCLKKAGMHAMLVVIPGHAQVAVETSQNSGQYFLIETTTLPYEGVNTSLEYTDPQYYNNALYLWKTESGEIQAVTPNGTAEEWAAYLQAVANPNTSYGIDGIFVVDCALQDILGIQGLESA